MNARQWLRANDYDDIADLVDEVMNEWQAAGKKQGATGGVFFRDAKTGNHVYGEVDSFPFFVPLNLGKGNQ